MILGGCHKQRVMMQQQGAVKKDEQQAPGRKMPLGIGPRQLAFVTNAKGGGLMTSCDSTFFIDQPHIRPLLVASTEIFLAVQEESKSSYPDPVPQKVISSLSRMYRSHLIELIKNLKDSGDLEGAELYSNVDFVWNFCEIMFLSSHPDFPILPYLTEWIKINFDLTADLLPQILDQVPDLDEAATEQLWTLIFSHTFHGATDDAARLLGYLNKQSGISGGSGEPSAPKSSCVQDRHVTLMTELLTKRPTFHPDLDSLSEFEGMWHMWQEECWNRLENGAFHGNDNFVFLCRILCGNDEALAEAVSRKQLSWYEYLVLILNYKYPTVRPPLLKAYARRTLEEFDIINKLEPRDMILLHAMDFDILSVLKEMQEVLDNPWFALHFSDLVYACGSNVSEDESIDYSQVTPLRSHFIMEYGTNIMEHPTMWQMGVFYLDALPEHTGLPVIRECLQRRNPSSEIEAQKLLAIAEKFGFGDEVKGICRQVCLSKLRYGETLMQDSLLWAVKAGDSSLTRKIGDFILLEGDGEIPESLFDCLQSIIGLGRSDDNLYFVEWFCKFRRHMQRKEYRFAASELCALIKMDLIPKRMSTRIILKNQELFDDPENFNINRGDVLDLMNFFHGECSPEDFTPSEFKDMNTKLLKLRALQILEDFNTKKMRKNRSKF